MLHQTGPQGCGECRVAGDPWATSPYHLRGPLVLCRHSDMEPEEFETVVQVDKASGFEPGLGAGSW